MIHKSRINYNSVWPYHRINVCNSLKSEKISSHRNWNKVDCPKCLTIKEINDNNKPHLKYKPEEPRTLSIVIEVDQKASKSWAWLYKTHMSGLPLNGLRVKSISEGDLLKEVQELEHKIDTQIESFS